jgi:hypothetical protein
MEAIDYWFLDLKYNWKKFLSKKGNFIELFFCVLYFLFVSFLFKKYLVVYETIPGIQLYDIMLDFFKPADVSVYIFVLLYTIIFFNYFFLIAYPRMLVCFFIFYATCLLIRFILLSFINLEPPLMYQEFSDPILSSSTYEGIKITKDLFFSGHMVTVFCAYFAMPNRILKFLYLIGSVLLALLLIVQHVHYTIDILGAYVVVFLIYRVYYEKIYNHSKLSFQYSKEIINY